MDYTYNDARRQGERCYREKVLKGEYADSALKLLDTVGGGIESGADGIGGAIGNLLGGILGK